MITIKTRRKSAQNKNHGIMEPFPGWENLEEIPEEELGQELPEVKRPTVQPPDREIPMADDDPEPSGGTNDLLSVPEGFEPKPARGVNFEDEPPAPPAEAVEPPAPEKEFEEIELPGLDIDDWNTLPPSKQIDIAIAMNLQRQFRPSPMPPLVLEIDYLTLPHPRNGAVKFYPKRLVLPEEKRVFGTGREILTAWDYTRNDYRRFVINQIQRSEIKEA